MPSLEPIEIVRPQYRKSGLPFERLLHPVQRDLTARLHEELYHNCVLPATCKRVLMHWCSSAEISSFMGKRETGLEDARTCRIKWDPSISAVCERVGNGLMILFTFRTTLTHNRAYPNQIAFRKWLPKQRYTWVLRGRAVLRRRNVGRYATLQGLGMKLLRGHKAVPCSDAPEESSTSSD
jgi:hypothetical protein